MNDVSKNVDKDVDLVCGMEVEKTTSHKVTYQGEIYLFCSEGCREHFKNDPEKYVRMSET